LAAAADYSADTGRVPFMTGKMEAKDGSVYWMKDGYVWSLIAKGEHPHDPK